MTFYQVTLEEEYKEREDDCWPPCKAEFSADEARCENCPYYELCLDEYEDQFTFRAEEGDI